MSYARNKRQKLVKRLKKEKGNKWKAVYTAKANQIKIEKEFLKGG